MYEGLVGHPDGGPDPSRPALLGAGRGAVRRGPTLLLHRRQSAPPAPGPGRRATAVVEVERSALGSGQGPSSGRPSSVTATVHGPGRSLPCGVLRTSCGKRPCLRLSGAGWILPPDPRVDQARTRRTTPPGALSGSLDRRVAQSGQTGGQPADHPIRGGAAVDARNGVPHGEGRPTRAAGNGAARRTRRRRERRRFGRRQEGTGRSGGGETELAPARRPDGAGQRGRWHSRGSLLGGTGQRGRWHCRGSLLGRSGQGSLAGRGRSCGHRGLDA